MTDHSHFIKALKFAETSKDRWQRRFDYPATGEYIITVSINKRTIDYPKPVVLGDRTTSNFDHPENFVVLECVCRLLAKGYDPATLILEKRYQLGRGPSGGKSDITVLRRTTDPEDQQSADPLLIIECKTFGKEHDSERQKTLDNGGQLFATFSRTVPLSTSASTLRSSRMNSRAKSSIAATSYTPTTRLKPSRSLPKRRRPRTTQRPARSCRSFSTPITVNRCTTPGKRPTTPRFSLSGSSKTSLRLTPLATSRSLVTYLRSSEATTEAPRSSTASWKSSGTTMCLTRRTPLTAFNRLCAIILAKLIDEERDPAVILDFQWFPNKDTSMDLIDRLQRLYKRGMKETLGEDITYFEERDIDEAFRAHRRDMARNEVKKIFRALKFYTNNDFAFKEVHNEKLFEQNTQVVREVVELFQNYRLKYTSKQAFLGNLFELLLNSGFKQSEGQFFTPIPIARFIVRCLPLRERMAASHERGDQRVIPRVMDYACGSAHFLTEVVEELQEDLAALGRDEAINTTWTRDFIWGIEKDYRLARTAKIAMFLHGAGDANILHEDGLDHANPTLPQPGTVDVLIANPPYSIASFKEHLRLQSNQFALLPYLTNASSEIETLFVERAAQLLKVGGLAGIILPSSILSNAGIYQRTRALLLEKFLLRGLVGLGGSAFIATGTNTIILLLERRPETDAEHFTIRADALFNEEKRPRDADFADSDLLRAYTRAAGLYFADYCEWLAEHAGEPPDALASTTLFKNYDAEFQNLAATKSRKKQVSFKKQKKAEQEAEIRGKLLRHIREAERQKFIHFALAYAERLDGGDIVPQRTTILRGSGSKADEQAFLGYKWSQRRGAEGMIYLREPYDGGQLYTPATDTRSEAPEKVAHHLRAAFLGTESGELPDDHQLHGKLLSAPTTDCLDFTRTTADLAVDLSPKQREAAPVFDTQYDLVPFEQMATLEYGKPLPERVRIEGEYPVMGSNGSVGTHNEYLIEGPAIIVGRKGSAGRVVYEERNCYPIDTTFYIAHNPKKTVLRFIQFILLELKLEKEAKALGVPGLNRNDVYKKLVPLTPLPVQRRIVKDIEKLEKKAETYVIRDLAEQKRQILLDGIR